MKSPIPQIIVGNRKKGEESSLTADLSKVGINHVYIQPGVYEHSNSRTNISEAHKNCIRYAKDQGWDYCIILEDDVKFTHPDSYRYFLDSMKNLPKDWDVYTSAFYTCRSFEKDYQNIYRVQHFAGLHCYAVNSKFYDTFLSCPDNHNIDVWVSENLNNYCYCCYPFAAIQEAGYSENVMQEKDYSYLLKDKELFSGFAQ